MPHSPQAYYDADIGVRLSRKFCTPGTRQNILADIEKWAISPDSRLCYWMCGMAGTGKSTIAMSTCKMLNDRGILAGTFFCSRQIPECRNYHLIVPTLAYQRARFSETFAESLVDTLGADPDITVKSLDAQVQALLVEPWKAVIMAGKMGSYMPVVIIDALDECEDVSLALQPLVSAIQQRQLPGLKFFLTSCPEQEIQLSLHSKLPYTSIQEVQEFILHNVEENEIQEDIYTYVRDELKEISPSEEQLTRLKVLAGKLFIYAATVVKFVNAGGSASNKKHRLISLLKEGQNLEDLNQLYNDIIKDAIPTDRLSHEAKQDWRILYTIMTLGEPLTCKGVAEILSTQGVGIESDDVEYLINNLQAVFYISTQNDCIFMFHESFFDFMTTVRGIEGDFYRPVTHHLELTLACINTMDQLRFNICDLPSSFIPDREVHDLENRIESNISETLQYACQFWSYHAMRCDLTEMIIQRLEELLMYKGIYWIEAMSLLGLLAECGKIGESTIKVNLHSQVKQLEY